jgi:hypothetical protein
VGGESNLLAILNLDLTSACETIQEFDALFQGRTGMRGLIRQQSPELGAPSTTGFTPWASQVLRYAHNYSTDDWSSPPADG